MHTWGGEREGGVLNVEGGMTMPYHTTGRDGVSVNLL